MNLTYDEILGRWLKFIAFLGVKLTSYQDELARELLRFPDDAKVKQARQTGKSFIMGLLLFFIAFELKWNIILAAPILDQTWAIMKVVHQVKRLVSKRKKAKNGKLRLDVDNRYEVAFMDRGSIRAVSGSETANVESKSANLIVIDEHQDLTWTKVAEVFKNMLVGTILFQSEKTGGACPFWSCGIGGEGDSVAERPSAQYEWELPWQKVLFMIEEEARLCADDPVIAERARKKAAQYRKFIEGQRHDMMPEEFAAHHECKRLDTSAKFLIPTMFSYDALPEKYVTTIGVDYGRSIDKTIATILHHALDSEEDFFIEGWLILQGSFDWQHERIVQWLRDEVTWDHILTEVNGIGHGPTDFLSKAIPEVEGITIDEKWKTRQAQKINRLCSSGKMKYNAAHEFAGVFVKDMTKLKYKMTTTSLLSVDHSDFLSSLMIAMEEPKYASVSV